MLLIRHSYCNHVIPVYLFCHLGKQLPHVCAFQTRVCQSNPFVSPRCSTPALCTTVAVSVHEQHRHQWLRRSSWRQGTLTIWTQAQTVTPQRPTGKRVPSTHQLPRTQKGAFARGSGGTTTTWRSPCPSRRSTVCLWSGGRQSLPSSTLLSTWSWPQWSSQWSTRGSRPKRAARPSRTSSLIILTGLSGRSPWRRSTAWCCWSFGSSSCSSSDTSKLCTKRDGQGCTQLQSVLVSCAHFLPHYQKFIVVSWRLCSPPIVFRVKKKERKRNGSLLSEISDSF